MTHKNSIIILTLSMLLMNTAFATDKTQPESEETVATKEPGTKLRDPAEFQKIIDEYKSYVATIPPEVREEIIAYRKEVAQLNKQKKLLYRKLSHVSQNYLKKEQQYKQQLPLNRKNLISIEDLNKNNEKNNTPPSSTSPSKR